jgi:predicted transcriptional regulator
MQRMEDKNMIVREDPTEGKSFLYRAVEKAAVTKTRLVDKMVQKIFDNSISDLMVHAIGRDKVSPEELEKIKELVDRLNKKTKS